MKIDNEFKNLIQPLTNEEKEELKESIKNEGVRDSLIVWNGILIDGHNRKEIADSLGKKYPIKEKEFKDRNEARIWIATNQLARRNVSPYDRVLLAKIKCEAELKRKAKEQQQLGGGSGDSGRQKAAQPTKVREEIAKIAGVSHDTVSKVEYIEKNVAEEEKEELHNPKGSINQVYTNIRKKKEREDIEKSFEGVEILPFPERKYQIIYADPPWKFWGGGWKNQAQHYHCEDINQLKQLKDKYNRKISDLADENCILFLWATYPILPDAIELIESWGFKYSTVGFTWVKTTKNGKWHFGLGYWTRANPEICLIATKGKPIRKEKDIPNLVISEVLSHSEKPKEVRDRIVRLMGNIPKIELFSREKIENWDAWGNEI